MPDAKEWKAFTIELKFKLDKGVDAKQGNALVCYAKNSWNRAQFLLWINKNGQVDIGDAVTIVNFLVGKTESLSRQATVWDEKEPQ